MKRDSFLYLLGVVVIAFFCFDPAMAQSDMEKFAEGRVSLDKFKDCFAAIEALETVSSEGRNNPLWVFYMAKTHECLANPGIALEYYQKYNSLVPGQREIIEKLAELRYEAKQASLKSSLNSEAISERQRARTQLQQKVEELRSKAASLRVAAERDDREADRQDGFESEYRSKARNCRPDPIVSCPWEKMADYAKRKAEEYDDAANSKREDADDIDKQINILNSKIKDLSPPISGANSAGYIAQLQSEVLSFNFYHTPGLSYQDRFNISSTSTISWKIDFRREEKTRPFDFPVEVLCYRPNHSLFQRITVNAHADAEVGEFSVDSKQKAAFVGKWIPGTYIVDFYVSGKKIITRQFEIY